ncbi:MAG: hypothetical protein PSN34_13940 [Urechidicola sp.]|nr:hypothetical protein [Urechidicola sp.]
MNLKQTLLIAIALSFIAIGSWETYWRSQGYYPGLEDDKDLWANQRAKVENTTKDDFVLLGSSRVLFDFQLNQWEAETGKRPIQLASAGTTPLPAFHDIVENTNYKGTIIVGVTPGLFFSTTYPLAMFWDRVQTRIDYYYNRTYAQRLNHKISIPLQNNFVFLTSDEEDWVDDLNLKTLVNNIKIGNRVASPMPEFYRFQDIYADRNVEMKYKAATDTAFANTIKKVWGFYGKQAQAHPPEKDATTAFFLKDLKKFKARGGNVILVRCPSSGGLRVGESIGLPRADFWDALVSQAKVPSYHFEDYEQFKNLECPEWSHLSAEDARKFTTELAKIMLNDGVITNSKTN